MRAMCALKREGWRQGFPRLYGVLEELGDIGKISWESTEDEEREILAGGGRMLGSKVDKLCKILIKTSNRIVQDGIIRVEDCYFLVDFLVVNMKMTKELSQTQIILGRPFLSTAKAIIDWGKGEVILKVGEYTMKVDTNKLMKYPSRAFEEFGCH